MSVSKDFVKAINESNKKKTQPLETEATVTRVEEKTAWVRMPGSETETPVKLTIDAKKGDTVQVRVSNGKATITGNSTAPPTDDKTANKALNTINTVSKSLNKSISQVKDSVDAIEESIEEGEFTVEGVYIQYILSTSNSSVVPYQGMDWSEELPEYVSGTYYWTRTVTVTEDEEEHISEPVLDLGAQLTAEVDQAQQSTNNHFWHDNTGAYVTEQDGDASSGYATRVTNSGILQTYNGNTLTSWTGSGVSFYRSGSNTALASFGTGGITFDNSLPFTIGNNSSYIRWVQENGVWKVKVRADEIIFGNSDLSTTLSDMEDDIDDAEYTAGVAYNLAYATNQHFVFSSSCGARVLSDSNNYSQLNSSGMTVVSGGSTVASFGSSIVLGTTTAGKVTISSGSVQVGNLSIEVDENGYPTIDPGSGRNLTIKRRLYTSAIEAAGSITSYYGITAGGAFNSAYTYTENTVTSKPNIHITSGGYFRYTTHDNSSRRYKNSIGPITDPDLDPHKLYDIEVIQFKYDVDRVSNHRDQHYDVFLPGFIAEQVEKAYPMGVEYLDGEIGNPVESWDAQYIIPPMLALIQEHKSKIDELEAEISKLKGAA